MTDHGDDELRALRERAYRRDSDIHLDPTLVARLHELENRQVEVEPVAEPAVPAPRAELAPEPEQERTSLSGSSCGTAMVDEEYNGLGSGNGKDAVVQLVQAFTAAGYPLDVEAWLRAYFAAGGTFRHGESVQKLVGEMKKGVKHRVRDRYRTNIVEILRDRGAAKA